MILDQLSSSPRYETLGPRFALAFQWLRSVDPADLPDGRIPLGDDVYVLVQRGLTKPLEQTKWEAHRIYADIQYVAAGREAMHWEALENTTPGTYEPEKDFLPLTTSTGTNLEVGPGRFAVFFPGDAHRPGIAVPGSPPVVKLVVKVKL